MQRPAVVVVAVAVVAVAVVVVAVAVAVVELGTEVVEAEFDFVVDAEDFAVEGDLFGVADFEVFEMRFAGFEFVVAAKLFFPAALGFLGFAAATGDQPFAGSLSFVAEVDHDFVNYSDLELAAGLSVEVGDSESADFVIVVAAGSVFDVEMESVVLFADSAMVDAQLEHAFVGLAD